MYNETEELEALLKKEEEEAEYREKHGLFDPEAADFWENEELCNYTEEEKGEIFDGID
ncbi:hypothetical protein [Macrococcus epidermidis]|uniref:hypothetical protein n=1 Tax=Macrococcus epidermidis TaxID=1902580 RepID=UPI0014766B9A|nr:hypothetical protein [Macrococcus epidermidis]